MKQVIYFLIALLLIVCVHSTMSQVPRVINYQGMLLGSNKQPVPEGNYQLTFKLYDESNNLLWTEIHNQVFIGGGLFNVILGTINPFSIPFDKPYFLGIQVGSDPELQPRMILTSAAYAIRADDSNQLLGYQISATPEPNKLLPLDNNAKFPASVLSDGVSGNFLKKNTPDTSRGTSTDPMLLVSNLGDGDGISGRSTRGRGVEGRSDGNAGVVGWTGTSDESGVFGYSTSGKGVTGRSDLDFGVVGWTGAESSDKSGVLGHSQIGAGVRGHSEASNGVVGWTNNSNSSGVFGFSDSGTGVAGRSGGNDGLLGVTTSNQPGNAGLRARNEGGGPAIFCEGDLYITGAIRGNLGSTGEGAAFPRPAYDSGWQPISLVGTLPGLGKSITLQHNLGGNPDNYVVDLQFRNPQIGVHQAYYGGFYSGTGRDSKGQGAHWYNLTNQNIMVYREPDDNFVEEVRVRLWIYK